MKFLWVWNELNAVLTLEWKGHFQRERAAKSRVRYRPIWLRFPDWCCWLPGRIPATIGWNRPWWPSWLPGSSVRLWVPIEWWIRPTWRPAAGCQCRSGGRCCRPAPEANRRWMCHCRWPVRFWWNSPRWARTGRSVLRTRPLQRSTPTPECRYSCPNPECTVPDF